MGVSTTGNDKVFELLLVLNMKNENLFIFSIYFFYFYFSAWQLSKWIKLDYYYNLSTARSLICSGLNRSIQCFEFWSKHWIVCIWVALFCQLNVSLGLISCFLRAQHAWMTSIGSRPWARVHLAEWCSSNIKGRTNSLPWRSWTNRKCVTILSHQQISPCMYWRPVH